MPYIKQEERKKWDKILREVVVNLSRLEKESVDGELNYFITSILKNSYKDGENKSYYDYNRAMGLLECIKQELYRREIAPYEEVKIKENGDLE